MYLVILKCPVYIEITSVCGQDGEIEAFKSMTVKLCSRTGGVGGVNERGRCRSSA